MNELKNFLNSGLEILEDLIVALLSVVLWLIAVVWLIVIAIATAVTYVLYKITKIVSK